MNNILRQYAGKRLKEDLVVLTLFKPEDTDFFKKLYSQCDLNKSLDDIVDMLDDKELDTAMDQVHRTLVKYSLAEKI